MIKKYIVLGLIFICSLPSIAQVSGGDITYEALDSFTYKVYFSLYRDCRSDSITVPSNVYVKCEGSTDSANIPMSLHSIEDATQICTKDSSGCYPPNKPLAGVGIEKQVYTGTFDLRDTVYQKQLSCCKLRIYGFVLKRQLNFTTGVGGTMYYNFALLDRCVSPLNNSTRSLIPHRYISACNEPTYRSFGIADTADMDSLSYEFARIYTSESVNVSFSGGYSFSSPIQVYYGSFNPPYSNPFVSPPIGMYLDSRTGDLIYTPVNCGEVAIVNVRVREYRKDSGGTYKEIGQTNYERIMITDSIQNNPPQFRDAVALSYDVCVGSELCMEIRISDPLYFPPPPQPPPVPDTASMQWSGEISGATFTSIIDSGRPVGKFCWTPSANDLRARPYTFTVQVDDNKCPYFYSNSRTYSISVRPALSGTVDIDSLGCGQFALTGTWDSISGLDVKHTWEILDSAMNPVLLSNTARFNSNSLSTSTEPIDTVQIRTAGKYYVLHQIENNPFACKNSEMHEINVPTVLRTDLASVNPILCLGDSISLQSATTNNNGPVEYRWFRNDSFHGDTGASLLVIAHIGSMDSLYRIETSDASGCTDFSEISVLSYDSILAHLDPYFETCAKSIDLEVDVQSAVASVKWAHGPTTESITVTQNGDYSVRLTDGNSCTLDLHTTVDIYPVPHVPLGDTILCDADSLDAGIHARYRWSTHDTVRQVKAFTQGRYWVKVTDENGCSDSVSFNVWLKPSPVVVLHNFGSCQDLALINMEDDIILQPTNPLRGIQSWACLNCSGGDFNHMLENKGNIAAPDYQLNAQDSVYTIQNMKTDTLRLLYTFIDTNNCSVQKITNIRIHKNPDPPVIYKDEPTGTIMCDDTVFWYRNDSALNVFSDQVDAGKTGTYTARAYDKFGCYSRPSAPYTRTTGIADPLTGNLIYYPNPTDGVLYIEDPDLQIIEIKLFDMRGVDVPLVYTLGTDQHLITWDSAENILVLRVQTSKGIQYIKILNTP